MTRRRHIILGAAALALAAAAALAQPMAPPAAAPDMALGNPKATVTVVEYASVGCPHCAVWARDVFPAFKAKYVDTGKVRFVLKEMLTGNPNLAAAGFMTARCAGPAKYFQVVDAVYASQEKLEQQGAVVLLGIAKDAGMTEAQFDACLRDPAALAASQARWTHAGDADKIEGTPAFVINGHKFEGEQSLADLDAAIAAARR
jgi:protein-disulfide isomerase